MDTVEAYERLVATIPGVEHKGDRMPYTSLIVDMMDRRRHDGSAWMTR